eukprot:gene32237-39806_t
MNNNKLSGGLQLFENSALNRGCELVDLDLSDNQLTGTIPLAVRNFTTLQQLILHNNILSGDLSVFASSTAMQRSQLTTISVSDNQLTGTVPSELFEIPAIVSVIVSKNCFHGSIPLSICSSVTLQVLAMDGLSTASSARIQHKS